MSQLEPNDFEERWRKAFEEASESPSDELWDRIEQKLPPEQPIGLPLFWIGTVLLFLLGTLGWWYYQSKDTVMPNNRPAMAQTSTPKESITPKTTQTTTEQPNPIKPASSKSPVVQSTESIGSSQTVVKGSINHKSRFERRGPIVGVKPGTLHSDHRPLLEEPTTPKDFQPSTLPTVAIQPTLLYPPQAASKLSQQEAMAVAEAQGKSWSLYTFGGKLQSPAVTAAPAIIVKPQSNFPMATHWIAFHSSWANFNPAVSTSGGYTSAFYSYAPAYSGQSLSAAEPQTDTYRNNSHISFLLELTGGTRLSRHWYLESGAQYLKGHSILNNNVILTSNSSRNSLYNQILESQKSSGSGLVNFPSNDRDNLSSVSVGSTNRFRYSFDFLSVPVSIGYNLRPEKRLNYFVTAGFTLDFFLKNVLVDDTYADIPPAEYGPKDGVYRNLTTSTQGAIGANYRITKKTSINLKAFARKSLIGGIKEGDYMQIKPLTVGIGLGIRRDL